MRYISADAVKGLYRLQNDAYDKVYASHLRQKKAREKIKATLQDSAVYSYREDIFHLDHYRFNTFISLGGDNHFIFVSHFVTDQFILGVNSDSKTSVGALLAFDTDSLVEKLVAAGDQRQFVTESWTRITGELLYPDGRKTSTGPCTSEISIRNSYPDTMSRYLIRREGDEWEEQKSSGLLLSCGAGSTGWYKNCLSPELYHTASFPKDAQYFKLVAREVGYKKDYRYRMATVNEGEVLQIVSEMEGEISIDANPDRTFDFPPGCIASFRLHDSKLNVVRDIIPGQ